MHASDVRLEECGLDGAVAPEHNGLSGVGDESIRKTVLVADLGGRLVLEKLRPEDLIRQLPCRLGANVGPTVADPWFMCGKMSWSRRVTLDSEGG